MNLTRWRSVFLFVGVILCLVITLESCIGEPCEAGVGKELIQFNHSSDVDSIEIKQYRLFTKNEYETGVLYNSNRRHIEIDSIDITVYINSVSTEMSFLVKDNKTLYVMLSDTSLHICENALSYQSFKLNNVEACFIYDSLSCP
jgi:hypothetical protein